jgi:hypothetical protein
MITNVSSGSSPDQASVVPGFRNLDATSAALLKVFWAGAVGAGAHTVAAALTSVTVTANRMLPPRARE